MLPLEEAVRIVEQHAAAVGCSDAELVELTQAGGRVLAEIITADRNFPPFPRATRDGYAVHASDAKPGAKLKIVGEIKAGAAPDSTPS